MEVPAAPWCVGSVFFPPQLLTSGVGPLRFNQVGNPQCLLSTGLRLRESESLISTKMTENYIKEAVAPFIPQDLLTDYVQSDDSSMRNSPVKGCLLQGLQCSDGKVLLFILCGKEANKVASTVCYSGSGGIWYSIQSPSTSKDTDTSEEARWPVSITLQHPVYQLSATWTSSSEDEDKGIATVAARCYYHIYFITVVREEAGVQFRSIATSRFQIPVVHVTWNPYIYEETAVLLENGEVHLLDVGSSGKDDPEGMLDLTTKLIIRSCAESLSDSSNQLVRLVHSEVGDMEQGNNDDLETEFAGPPSTLKKLKNSWRCCEFGWLPQTLLVANSKDVFLVDLKLETSRLSSASELGPRLNIGAENSMKDLNIMASVRNSESSIFCLQTSEEENIVAFGRPENGRSYEFSVATECHVILFDLRQPRTPILQWEHGMKHEPPDLLIMCSMTSLRSFGTADKPIDFQDGKVILAANFQSGDVRVFCYGPGICGPDPPLGSNPKRQKVDGHNWVEAEYAWDTPSRLYAPLSDVGDWTEVVSSSRGLHGQNSIAEFVPRPRKGWQIMAGLVLLSITSTEAAQSKKNKKTFDLLQLTGCGELLAQTYEASHELQEPLTATISSLDYTPDTEQPIGELGTRDHDLKYEVMPSFLNYIRTGSALAPAFSKNVENMQKKSVPDFADGASINSSQANPRGESTRQKEPCQGTSVESTGPKMRNSQTGLENDLKTFIADLNVPLSMYEVAQRVLCMGLPKRLSLLAPHGSPHAKTVSQGGSGYASVFPVLETSARHSKFGDPEVENDCVSTKGSLQGDVPLPLLLELYRIEKTNEDPSYVDSHDLGTKINGEFAPNRQRSNGQMGLRYDCVPLVDGLFVESGQRVEAVVEKLALKTEPLVVSLDEPAQSSQNTLNELGDADSDILLYSLSRVGVLRGPDSRKGASSISTNPTDVGKSSQRVGVEDVKLNPRYLSEGVHLKFVTRLSASTNEEQQTASTKQEQRDKQYLKIDPKLCPINLCFQNPGEELEQEELAAIEDLQSDFLQWQQSFTPYRSVYDFRYCSNINGPG